MSIEAMKQWLEALETINQLSIGENAICLPAEIDGLMDYLRQAIAELESQEPVATVTSETGADITMSWWHEPALPIGTKLYTHPPQRTWVGLTDEEVERIKLDGRDLEFVSMTALHRFAQDIEAKLKEKNSG